MSLNELPLTSASFPRNFTSDNNSGVLPEVMDFLARLNLGHSPAYGGEFVTQKAQEKISELFGAKAQAFFVFNGTAANVCALKALCKSYESVICTEHAHIHKDECAAPEAIAGVKLLVCPSKDGKLLIAEIEKKRIRLGDQHCAQPKVISITQPTELGTVYTKEEIQEIVDYAHSHSMYVHVDGSRFVNAAAHLGCSLSELSSDLGIDALSLGGTKNGLMLGEAVIFFDRTFAHDFKYIRKQALQLAGKMRFLSGQFLVWLTDNLWLKYANNANQMAELLQNELQNIPGIEITQPVQTNVVFAKIPRPIIQKVRKKYFFYVWDEISFECRLMTSFDTSKEDILGFSQALRDAFQEDS